MKYTIEATKTIDNLIEANNNLDKSIEQYRKAMMSFYGENGEEECEAYVNDLLGAYNRIEALMGRVFFFELCARTDNRTCTNLGN